MKPDPGWNCEKPLLARAFGWMHCLSSAVKYLHGNGILHQDLKPANILVKGQTLWLTDFGVSFQSDDDASRYGLLGSDHPGTADYCAPEQNEGDSYVGTKADIFSLGCVFAEVAISSTGSTPTA